MKAAGGVSPNPPVDAYYVDALAVATEWRRQGVAQHLLDDAQVEASRAGLRSLALDTGLQNQPARALYEAYGFGEREIRRAPNDKTARALGGRLRRLPQSGVEHGLQRVGDSATWPSVISGKNGRAIDRAATSSQTGNSPSRWPKRSR